MEPEHQITFGPFRLEARQGCLWRDDQAIPLRTPPTHMRLVGSTPTCPLRNSSG